MKSSETRIGGLAVVFLAAAAIVLTHLLMVMVGQHDLWAARSHKNRWAFRSVPSLRGSLLDRHGRVLLHDEPTMQVTIYYLRFRLRHPVGAAVHGATTWARLQPGGDLVTYAYSEGLRGPRTAVRELLAIPVRWLLPGALPKQPGGALATALTTVVSGTTGMPRRRAYRAMRDAAEERPELAVGDVIPGFTRSDLLRAYDELFDSLMRFDRELLLAPEMQRGTKHPGLVGRLEWLRQLSLNEAVLEWRDDEGQVHTGEKYENVEWPVADYVPFALAAPLRVGAKRHPGLRVQPGVHRVGTVPEGSALRALLGEVREVGRSEPDDWMERYLGRKMPEDWLDEVVPDEAAASDFDRGRMRRDAKRSFESMTRRLERRGVGGAEFAFDGALSGRLGMRLVERDSKQREQLMWSSLRVEIGEHVQLTIDRDLQEIAERLVIAAQENMLAAHDDGEHSITELDQKLVKASLAVIDARSGDVLAMAGAPIESKSARGVPGLSWGGNGALGSVVKPFVLLEQLLAETAGRPCVSLTELEPCSGKFRYGGRTLHCDYSHWDEGKHPVRALAKSCNLFFYQLALGLEPAGVDRALQRFGLLPAEEGSEFRRCWQRSIYGMPWYRPARQRAMLPQQAIGYGVQASPLAVARAYAALATGRLPELGVVLGERRASVELADMEPELTLVRRGLELCVLEGTAVRVEGLKRFGVLGKTGTAEVGEKNDENNAWFAGYLPWTAGDGVQLCFTAVVYWTPDGQHGAAAAGTLIADFLANVNARPDLAARYITPGGGRVGPGADPGGRGR
ncbi:MAG: penicillin-binding transpeptidase domain-containing protein [bacterium]|nr:penicillin-binding transpeptidase domain-containing protein [bacterium]